MADNDTVNDAVATGGSYEVIRKRLEDQNKQLEEQIAQLNVLREQTFGKTEIEVIDRIRVRTENNCVPRDIVRINNHLLFGYNVFIGLKKETKVQDVFALYSLEESEGKFSVKEESIAGSFLDNPLFTKQFQELYSYYKKTQLVQLRIVNQKLLAAFQIGDQIGDIRVFRWGIGSNGEINYIDDRGERDNELPPSYDFEWEKTTREQFVEGRHPHVSILDEVFVETVGGDLTIKIEDNTEDGEGIYSEMVEEPHQSLEDAEIFYAKVQSLILLKVLPYKETTWRFFVFNTKTHEVLRIDEIGHACIQLPNDNGIIFPGGYYLQSGESKVFAENVDGLRFKRRWISPNGEDVLYVFYERHEGKLALFSYNIITKELQSPIFAHGYSVFEDGKMVVFRSDSSEPTRIHPMQVWKTPYTSEEFHAAQPEDDSELTTIGNAELVQGISELYSISKLISEQTPSVIVYEDIIKNIQQILDGYYWLENKSLGDFSKQLRQMSDTSELVLDEFEKVKTINQESAKALKKVQVDLKKLLRMIQISNWETPEPFVDGLLQLKQQKGHLLSLRDYRYIDTDEIDRLNNTVTEEITSLGGRAVNFLSKPESMASYQSAVEKLHKKIAAIKTVKDLKPVSDELDQMSTGLDALSEVINGLEIDDTLQKTAILESVSKVYSRINQTKAHARLTIKELSATESVAEFSAQLAVLSQSITSGLALAESPEACDEQLARLMVQLEELESNFSDNDAFLDEIINKREELHESFENKKQTLTDERQRKATNIQSAANRVLSSVERKSLKIIETDELNTYFSSDPMVHKVSQLISQLRSLDDHVKADDVESKLKSVKEQAIRSLRDKKDIFEDGGQAIKLGKHRFSVNSQPLDLTILPKDDALVMHLTGTDFYQAIADQRLNDYQAFWQQVLSSENNSVYRAEYLAYSVFQDALSNPAGLSLKELKELSETQLQEHIKDFASPRYQEGYEKGVHDHDASKILKTILEAHDKAPLLMHAPAARSIAAYFWLNCDDKALKQKFVEQAKTAQTIATTLGNRLMFDDLCHAYQKAMSMFYENLHIDVTETHLSAASVYLLDYLAHTSGKAKFQVSNNSVRLVEALRRHLESISEYKNFNAAIQHNGAAPHEQWQLAQYWLTAVLARIADEENQNGERYVTEAMTLLLCKTHNQHDATGVVLQCKANDLLGDHSNIDNRELTFEFDAFFERLNHFENDTRPNFNAFKEIKHEAMQQQRSSMALETFKARPLASFVRNKLINESYLPIIGDNLAKQMGVLGQNRRSDLMGLLLLISPPGYGKTTLMEYTANRLGLNFMKINCPSLGHDIKSLDPGVVRNATAKQELEKLNLALEMGNNVMLYLDDIQHTHPEFLQKFISLCDGTRKIDGVWQGESKTYDLRGKKFCVIMAGNPYTESGEVFKIPDMLANRADVYNLGDVLSGQEDIFALSYIENSLTSNPVLAPLALRDMNDLYLLIDMARGKEVATSDLSHSYPSTEINEITAVLKHLFEIQNVILQVNQEYIRSAAMQDRYRVEPPFKLQGSYRNMNKLAEKIVPVMDASELQELIDDHYVGEAQLLTTGAEENLLKLKELRGTLSGEEQERWEQIKSEFKALNSLAGDDADGATKIASQLAAIKGLIGDFSTNASDHASKQSQKNTRNVNALAKKITDAITAIKWDVSVVNEPLPGLDEALGSLSDTLKTSFVPLIITMHKKLNINTEVLEEVTELSKKIESLAKKRSAKTVTRTTKKVTKKTTKK